MDTVQRAIDYIEDRLTEPLDLERIAAAAAMSLSNLYRLFYALTGHTIKDYIRKRRTSEAARRLRRSNLQVLDIALDCGFETYQSFAKSFKKLTGLTPGNYRKSERIYSFERIELGSRVDYLEDRELSDRFPDVRVYRIGPLRMKAYDYFSDCPYPEELAFRLLFDRLGTLGIDADRIRAFGCNLESAGESGAYGYRIMVLDEESRIPTGDGWFETCVEESLYAVNRIPYGDPSHIVQSWDQALAEWLPRSAFSLGRQPYLEEYIHENGSIVRMKLYLPVQRKPEQEPIDIVHTPIERMVGFREHGFDCARKADDRLIRWLEDQRFDDDLPLRLYMTCSYGMQPGPEAWYELGLVWPAGLPLPRGPDSARTAEQGGLYARMRTGAFGAMTGVLDRLYRWLAMSDQYASDETRMWLALYAPDDVDDLERTTLVECYIPILPKEAKR